MSVKQVELKENEIIALIDKAIEARELAYTPYSKFKVGACVVDVKDNIYTGSNIENASYGLAVCAERNAIFKGVTQGMRQMKTIAVVADTDKPVSPCGACRQVIAEFSDDSLLIILANLKKQYKLMTLEELIPYRFSGFDLPNKE